MPTAATGPEHAILLAAGKGERLWPLTATRPKPVVPVRGEPLVSRLLRQVHEAGLQRATVIVAEPEGPVARLVQQDGKRLGLAIDLAVQRERRGTGHALQQVQLPEDEPVLVAYGDLFLPEGALAELVKAGPAGAIAARRVQDASAYGALQVTDGRLQRIVEKAEDPPSDLVNAGVYVLPAGIGEHVHALKESQRGELELTDALTAAAGEGTEIRVHELTAWMDVAWPWDLLAANELALSEMRAEILGEVDEGATLNGPVHVEKGAHVHAGSTIQGPVWIGPDATVGPGAYLRPGTTLGAGAKVGHGCEVKNSVLMERAKVPHLSYVGDSVLGREVNLGAGTQVANLRHDGAELLVDTPRGRIDSGRRKLGVILGDGVKTGVNATLNCGVMLGPGELVGPGERVMRSRLPP